MTTTQTRTTLKFLGYQLSKSIDWVSLESDEDESLATDLKARLSEHLKMLLTAASGMLPSVNGTQ